MFSINQYGNLLLFDDPGRVKNQITSVVCKIQRFDFDCNMVVTRQVIIRIPPPLRLKPLYAYSAVRLTHVPLMAPFYCWFSLRKCDDTVPYHLYIVTRYLWLLVPHTIGICLWSWVTDPQVPHNHGKTGQNTRKQYA